MGRSAARAVAMQMLFEHLLGGDGGKETMELICEQLVNPAQPEAQVASFDVNGEDEQYIEEALRGVLENGDQIDALIEKYSVDWTIDRMSKVDLTILRLAIYEICYTDVPGSVAANEAVELSRKYSEPGSGRFINGIIGSIIRSEETKEKA